MVNVPSNWQPGAEQANGGPIEFYLPEWPSSRVSKNSPTVSLELRPRAKPDLGAPPGEALDSPKNFKIRGRRATEYVVKQTTFGDFGNEDRDAVVETYLRVIRIENPFGQVVCELRAGTQAKLERESAKFVAACSSVRPVPEGPAA